MAKTKISEYSSTAGNNTDINSINLAEGMAPSLVNNAIRQLMAQLKDFQAGTAGDSLTVGGNLAVTGTSTLTGAITATAGVSGPVVSSSATITGGTINGTPIGGSSPSTVTGTTITAGTGFVGSLTGNVTGNITGNTTGTHTGAVTGNVTGNLTGNVTSAGTSTFNNVTITGTLDMDSGTTGTITGLATPSNASDAATKSYVDSVDTAKLNLSGGTMSGNIAMGGNKVTGLGTPTADADAVTKSYVDAIAQGVDAKASCKVATTANITLSGTQTIDGVAVIAADRVLVKNQTTSSENGIYVVASGSWTRATDADVWTELVSAYTFVEQGTANAANGYLCTVAAGGTLGSTAVTFTQFSGAGQITAGAGLTKTGNQLDVGTASASRIVVNADNIDLATTGVSASTYKSVTVDTYGRITAGTNPTTISGFGITDAYTKTEVDTTVSGLLPKSGGTMTGNIVLGSNKATSTATPTTDDDLTRKAYVDSILGSATSAATSAAAAATSASQASTSATNASTSAGQASDSANAAAASYDAFDDRYLGSKSADPTVDNDGNPLLTGALYWNSTVGQMRAYNGSAWVAAYLPSDNYTFTGNVTLGDASTDTVTVNGYMGVGGSASSDVGVYVTSPSLVGASQYGIWSAPVANASATSLVVGALLTKSTAAASFTTSNAISLRIGNGVKGAGSTITSNTGIEVLDQTNGTNNYGITSLVSSGTNKWNLYASGTARNYMAGALSVGATTDPGTGGLYVAGNTTLGDASTDTVTVGGKLGFGSGPATNTGIYYRNTASALTGSASGFGLYMDVPFASDVTSSAEGARIRINTATASYTTNTAIALRLATPVLGVGSSITNLYGIIIDDQTQGTNNYGITSLVSSGTNKWNIYASGTAANYFAGNTLFGASGTPTTSITISKSAASAWMNATNGTVDNYFGVSHSSTAGNIGTITNHPLTFSTNNTERMRIDSSGNVGIGTSSPAYKLDVNTTGGAQATARLYGNDQANVRLRLENVGSGGRTWELVGGLPGANNSNFSISDVTGSTTPLTLDSSGNLGLGVTPSGWAAYKALQVASTGGALSSSSSSDLEITTNAYYSGGWLSQGAGVASSRYRLNAGTHAWFTAPSGTAGNAISFTQAMTLDSSGNLLVGTSSGTGKVTIFTSTNTIADANIKLQNSGGAAAFASFYNGDASSLFGSIVKGAGSTVTYNTSSDYRLKNTIAPMTGALAKVAQLKPCTYKWNADGSDGEGFIAHELAEVCPHAVTGEKDAVDAEGKPVYQGIDTSFLVATLTAALQEQQAIIESLKARLDAANI